MRGLAANQIPQSTNMAAGFAIEITLSLRWALVVLVLASATTTYGNGWSLPSRQLGILKVRGGGDDGDTTDGKTDSKTNGEDAMQELRKKWSDIFTVACPTQQIAGPTQHHENSKQIQSNST